MRRERGRSWLALGLLAAAMGCAGTTPDGTPASGSGAGTGGAGAGGTGGSGGSPASGPTGGTGGAATSGATGDASGTGGDSAGTGGDAPGSGGSGGAAGSGAAGAGAAGPADAQLDAPTGAGGGNGDPCPTSNAYPASLVDPKTCLVWQKKAGPLQTNKQAAKTCDQLVQDGHSDWRVPAPEELATWPNLVADSNAYITNPIYIPTGATLTDGCTGNSHSCNLTVYNPGSLGCGWQGVGFAGPVVCVRGTARPGTTTSNLAATACDACRVHLVGNPAEFKLADCLPFASMP